MLKWYSFLSNPSVLTLPLSVCFHVMLWKLKASQTSLPSVVFGVNAIRQTWIGIGNIHWYLSNPTSLRNPLGPVDILHFFVALTGFCSAFCHNVAKHCFLQNLSGVCYGTAKLWQLCIITLEIYPSLLCLHIRLLLLFSDFVPCYLHVVICFSDSPSHSSDCRDQDISNKPQMKLNMEF